MAEIVGVPAENVGDYNIVERRCVSGIPGGGQRQLEVWAEWKGLRVALDDHEDFVTIEMPPSLDSRGVRLPVPVLARIHGHLLELAKDERP